MQIYMPDEQVVETQDKGFIIHRNLFDQTLVRAAVNAGVEFFPQTRAIGYEHGLVYVEDKGDGFWIKPDVIIGADGPYSVVGKWMGNSNQEFVYTAQYRMRLRNELKSIQIYFHKDIPGGYGWVFPKGEVANVGVGVVLEFGITPVAALRGFVKYLHQRGLVEPEVLNITGGVIPVGGLVRRIQQGNMLVAGDAAGTAHPVTGAGVLNAVFTGKIAGEAAAYTVLEHNMDRLSEYEEECRILLDDTLKRAWQKRKAMVEQWMRDFISAIHTGWMDILSE
jgi:flavin-dependent dehydrogenase